METQNNEQAPGTTPSISNLSRREWITRVGLAPLAAMIPAPTFGKSNPVAALPAKDRFAVKDTYINGAYTHPMSISTAAAAEGYVKRRLDCNKAADDDMNTSRVEIKNLFARLINAQPQEIALVPSTMVGENLIVSGLGLPDPKNRIVTDALHFDGSLYLYGQLAKKGQQVEVIRPRDNRIDLKDMDAAIRPGTKLVALSLVSTVNGFQHDLKAVCDLAHARGAFVFADIIQAAGAVPIDVKASGVDFCACASYKWLMGDFGVGFLYVRQDRLDQLKRTMYGFRQIASFTSHTMPFDPPGTTAYDWTSIDDVGGHFQVGTFAGAAIVALRDSLGYLLDTGVPNIQSHRLPFIKKLQAELPSRGFLPLTPPESTSPVISFAFKDAEKILKPKLEAARVNISVYPHRIRISPSVYNDMADIDKLIQAVS
ncbi:MAG TPA: aminotransferase class V-fold PLP-dependent enzyme [Cyclobacteriaceae bacterium]|nr:aminotransferase class V-fold PLP-dependent enzyme [Cyclobacteriaceae bacterium]